MAYRLSISGKFQNLNQCPMTERPAIATRNFPSVSPAPLIFSLSPFPFHSPSRNHYISPEKRRKGDRRRFAKTAARNGRRARSTAWPLRSGFPIPEPTRHGGAAGRSGG